MNRIKILRIQNNVSQGELAAYLNVKPNTVSRYENGAREPDLGIVLKLADYFQVTTDYLLGRTSEQQTDQPISVREVPRRSSSNNSTNISAQKFIKSIKALLRELDAETSQISGQTQENELDAEIMSLYHQLDETARIQVKGYIHRLLDDGRQSGLFK